MKILFLIILFSINGIIFSQSLNNDSIQFYVHDDVHDLLPIYVIIKSQNDSLMFEIDKSKKMFNYFKTNFTVYTQSYFAKIQKIDMLTYHILSSDYEINSIIVNAKKSEISLLKPNNMTFQAGMSFGPELALTSYPDIMTQNITNNKMSVKGGQWFENLYSLNNIPIYYPYHFNLTNLGTSTLNYELLDDIEFHSNHISVSNGNLLSSVLDLKMYTPRKNESNVTLSSYKVNINIKNKFKKHSFVIGLNKTYFQKVGTLLDIDYMKKTPDLMNLQGFYSYNSDEFGIYEIIFHATNDSYDFKNFDNTTSTITQNSQSYFNNTIKRYTIGMPLNNNSFTVGLNHTIYIKKLKLSQQIWHHKRNEFYKTLTNYNYKTIVTNINLNHETFSSVYNHEINRFKDFNENKTGMKSTIYLFLKNQIFSFGFDYEKNQRDINLLFSNKISHYLKDSSVSPAKADTIKYTSTDFIKSNINNEKFNVASLYASYQFEINNFYFYAGMRYQYYSHINYNSIEPRINVSYKMNNKEIYLTHGSFSQLAFLDQLTSKTYYSKPIKNNQITFGILGSIFENWNYKIELYKKNYLNQFNANRVNGFPEIIYSDQNNSKSYSKGFNTLIAKQIKQFSFSLAYGYSESKQLDLIDSKYYNLPNSVQHKMSLTTHIANNTFLNPTLKFNVRSGLPYNRSSFNDQTSEVTNNHTLDMNRNPVYQLDLLFSYSYSNFTYFIDCINVFATKQVLMETDFVNPFANNIYELSQIYSKDVPLLIFAGVKYKF